MPANLFVDLHCHPTLRPYGRFVEGGDPTDVNDNACIWNYYPPNLIHKIEELAIGVAKYSQSNFYAAALGDVHIICVSFYAPEVKFFDNKLGENPVAKELENFITEYGITRIKEIESGKYDYFNDVEAQYKFLKKLNGFEVKIKNNKYRYVIVNSYEEIYSLQQNKDVITIAVIINMEGGHGFGSFTDPEKPIDNDKILRNVDTLKKWAHKPLYITMAHHFYNGLCGHTRSIPEFLEKIIDQSYGLETGMKEIGEKVIRKLLDKSQGCGRILIDVKHMSIKSRKRYYEMLDKEYKNEKIPIIFSHGGVNGLKTFNDAGKEVEGSLFNEWSISLFDEEIVRIINSDGLIRLNIDQRVMSSKEALKKAKNNISRHKMLFKFTQLIWNNVQHIAQVADTEGLNAWNNICIGSDFDGAINPINGIWTEEEMVSFEDYLNMHAFNFMKSARLSKKNTIYSDEIVSNIMKNNVINFLQKYF